MTVAQKRVMDLWDAGKSIEMIAAELGVQRRYVYRVVAKCRDEEDDYDKHYDLPSIRESSDKLLAAIMKAGLVPA